jgi:predicted transposase YbfD/YdcC
MFLRKTQRKKHGKTPDYWSVVENKRVAGGRISARPAAIAIRHHWHIESTLHHTRDVTFQEDRSRIRHNPAVFARLRSSADNMPRRNQTSTFKQDRYAAALAGFDALTRGCFS